jgi:hypothetical protein
LLAHELAERRHRHPGMNPVAIWDLVSGKFGNPAAGNGLEMKPEK